MFYGIRGLKKFQLVQKRLDLMEIKIIKDSEWIPSREPGILEQIRSYMRDNELDIELRFVDEIERNADRFVLALGDDSVTELGVVGHVHLVDIEQHAAVGDDVVS